MNIKQVFLIAAMAGALATVSTALGGQPLISTMGNVRATQSANGFYIAPVSDVRQISVAGDEASPQVFEIVRPYGEAIQLGRLNTSCSCVLLEASQSMFAAGERAFITLRNVRPTPPNGQMYTFYVQVVSPIQTTLRFDTFVQSDRFQQLQTYPVEHRNHQTTYHAAPVVRTLY